jgi:hypothetical protein
MKDRLALAQAWFRKADSDLADARRTVASEGPYDTACFHAQQAAEKYLKGYPYAVELRYDAEFWPPRSTADEAVALAQQIRALILPRVPASARP